MHTSFVPDWPNITMDLSGELSDADVNDEYLQVPNNILYLQNQKRHQQDEPEALSQSDEPGPKRSRTKTGGTVGQSLAS